MPKKRVPTLQGLLRRLKPHVVEMGKDHLVADGLFRCITRSAIVKAFEFACHAQTKVKELFFVTATLRGVCEDMITLSFLSSLPNRDEVVGSLIDDNLQEGLECQTSFFNANRPGQPVVRSKPGQREQAKGNLLNLAKAQRWDRGKLPTVREMAKVSGLVELYDYMYSATSKWVHCSPHVLLRMVGAKSHARKFVPRRPAGCFQLANFPHTIVTLIASIVSIFWISSLRSSLKSFMTKMPWKNYCNVYVLK